VQLYGEAFAHAQRVRDAVSAALLHDILQAEAAHLSGIDLVLTQGVHDD
jgi:hypothetical protein